MNRNYSTFFFVCVGQRKWTWIESKKIGDQMSDDKCFSDLMGWSNECQVCEWHTTCTLTSIECSFFFSRKNLEGSHGMAMVEQICCFFRCVWLSSVYFDHNCSPNWIFILFMWQTDHIGRNHISLHMFASWQRHKIEKCLRRAEALLYCNKYLMLISNQLTAHKFYFDQMHFFRNIKNFDRNHHSWMTVTFMWWTFDFFSSSI